MKGSLFLFSTIIFSIALSSCIEEETTGGESSSSITNTPPANPTPLQTQASMELLMGIWEYGRVVCTDGTQLELHGNTDRIYFSPSGVSNVIADQDCALNASITSVSYQQGSITLNGVTSKCSPSSCSLSLGLKDKSGRTESVTGTCNPVSSNESVEWQLGDDAGSTVLYRTSVLDGGECTKVYSRVSLDDPGFDDQRSRKGQPGNSSGELEQMLKTWNIGVW